MKAPWAVGMERRAERDTGTGLKGQLGCTGWGEATALLRSFMILGDQGIDWALERQSQCGEEWSFITRFF